MELNFAVISDIHVKAHNSKEDEKLDLALSRLKEYQHNLDALIITGDITNSGREKEYKKFNKIYNKYSEFLGEKIFLMGNHDCWGGVSIKAAQKRFKDNLNEDINSHKVIKGYHFISISTEGKRLSGLFSKKLLAWLKNELEVARDDDYKKPIFLGVHQHIENTVYGSEAWGNKDLYEVLKEFPQVINFSGHSHYPLNDERSIHQKDFTSVGAGSTSYIELERGKVNGTIQPKADKVSQGLIVKVSEDNVVKIATIDFTKKQVNEDRWIINEPSNKDNFLYTDNRRYLRKKPYFKKESSVHIKYVTNNVAKISFTQALHEDFIHSYEISVVNKNNNKEFKKMKIFSDFYMEYIKSRLSFKIKGLFPNTEYTVRIKAIESFGNKSENYLQTDFKTLSIADSLMNFNKLLSISRIEENSIDFD
ncbi:metallophosphoesterase [Clostridium sp. UBA1652]|uniref:metallophosphoesterase n=1 Tax=Clostridium sp. UBA1652 TaxID=1946348 RepID=UPI00257ECB1E|nr:metallophosphoesterase [Clostridium sp. UBA1652]